MDRRSLMRGAAVAAGTMATGGRALAQDTADFAGDWGGLLVAGGGRLRLRVVIETGRAGTTATLYSLDQGAVPIPSGGTSVHGDRLRVQFPSIDAELHVRLVSEDRLAGDWWQNGRMPITLDRDPDFEAMAGPMPALTTAYLRGLRQLSGSPALAAAARLGDAPTVAAVDGRRSVAGDAVVTLDDPWHLGSITKSATATLVARAVEAGAVSWRSTVGEVLGTAALGMREAYRDATLLHLLSHGAGLPANIETSSLLQYPLEEADPRESRLAYTREALAQTPAGPIGDAFVYSNSGFVIAGAMLETLLGAPWETLIRRHVFAPLGLGSAGFGPPGTPGLLDAPVGHSMGLLGTIGLTERRTAHPPGPDRADNPAVLGPAGRMHMTLPDLLVFLAAHRDRTGFLTPQSWDRLHTPPFGGGYALGLIVRGDGALWHNGSNTLWYAEALIDPVGGVVAAAAANDGVLSRASSAVAQALASAADTAAASAN